MVVLSGWRIRAPPYRKKVKELVQNINELERKLGPEYPALLDSLWNIDPTSQDAKEIGSILDKLDDFCGN